MNSNQTNRNNQMKENTLITNKHVLVCATETDHPELDYLKKNFCGIVDTEIKPTFDQILYVCGDLDKIGDKLSDVKCVEKNVIAELSRNYKQCADYNVITIGMVPIHIPNIGIYFRNFFGDTESLFDKIKKQHEFQPLTESNKPGKAYRKGIYLSKVENKNEEYRYKMLRCSTNFEGPTDNFRDVDNMIIKKVNSIAEQFFEQKIELNHVLAQIYENDKVKAVIKAHTDKTKDMPRNGLIAFCTFYDWKDIKAIVPKNDMFDRCYGKTSMLTEIVFHPKDKSGKINIRLYSDSVLIIPLSTNRSYTHEIKPSVLSKEMIPTRMGYVIRCSKTNAVYRDGITYIEEDGKQIKLEKITDHDRKNLTQKYFEENATDKMVEYGPIYFSMNNGDYVKPSI